MANEQLQYYFNQHIFAWELEELRSEGIKPTSAVSYVDNKPLLDMFLQRPLGLFALLDEESYFPKATDKTLVEKMHKNLKKHKQYYDAPQNSQVLTFTITHFAGSVTYDAVNFLEKNRDSLSSLIETLMLTSKSHLVRLLFKIQVDPTGSMSNAPNTTPSNKTAR